MPVIPPACAYYMAFMHVLFGDNGAGDPNESGFAVRHIRQVPRHQDAACRRVIGTRRYRDYELASCVLPTGNHPTGHRTPF